MEFFTKGFEYYYKPGLFNKDLSVILEKYQDPSFVIVEGDDLVERYAMIGTKNLAKAKIDFTEITESIRSGSGVRFISQSMKQLNEGGNCMTKFMM